MAIGTPRHSEPYDDAQIDCEAALDAHFHALKDAGAIAAGWQPQTVRAAVESLERHRRAMVLYPDDPPAD